MRSMESSPWSLTPLRDACPILLNFDKSPTDAILFSEARHVPASGSEIGLCHEEAWVGVVLAYVGGRALSLRLLNDVGEEPASAWAPRGDSAPNFTTASCTRLAFPMDTLSSFALLIIRSER